MTTQRRLYTMFLAGILLSAGAAYAQVPQLISYQGLVTDTARRPVPDGTYSMTVRVYDAPTGGTLLWSETHLSVPIRRGLFDVTLGSVTPLGITFNAPYYLGVSVNGAPELEPRTQFTTSPYSFWSQWADSAMAVPANAISTVNLQDGAVTLPKISAVGSTAGQVLISAGDSVMWGSGVGVTSLNGATGDLQLLGAGGTQITRNGNQLTIRSGGITSINTIDPAIGITDPTGPAVTLSIVPGGITEPLLGDQSVTTPKIAPSAVTPSKINSSGAVAGQSLVYTGTGVAWGNPIASGLILPFSGVLNDPAPGISIDNQGAGIALYGVHSASTGTAAGVRGESNSDDQDGAGVVGVINSTNPGGFSAGVRGTNNGTGGLGVGVYGEHAGSGWGVYGTSPDGYGVYGVSTTSIGVYAQSTSGMGLYAISTSGQPGMFEINDNTNTNWALTATTNGQGGAVLGTHTATTGTAAGVQGETGSSDPDAVGVRGVVTSVAAGILSSGVRGINNSTTADGIGVYGSQAGSGWGVYGTTPGGMGVYGSTTTGTGLYGDGNAGTGVYGISTSGEAGRFEITNAASTASVLSSYNTGNGTGLYVQTTGTGSAGQFIASNAASTANAVTVSSSGTGRAILATRAGGSGLILASMPAIHGDNTDGAGVAGTSSTGPGVYGTSTSSDGVWGVGSSTGTAGVRGRNDVAGGRGVEGQSFGSGIGVYGMSTDGVAGRMEITNSASAANAFEVTTAGVGNGIRARRTNAAATSALVDLSTDGGGPTLQAVMTGTDNAGEFQISNAANSSTVVNVSTNGIGNGISVQLTNPANGARGIEVTQTGVGPGVFATSAGGNALWGITSSISAAGVIGDNTFGEAVVGRNRGGNGVGAVVGRNDSSGYGVRGFNTKNGIGVLGQAGISGGTGVGGRFENVNAANGSNALEAVTNGTGWAARFTNANNSAATKGLQVQTTAGWGGNALDIANGTISWSVDGAYAGGTIDDGTLVITAAGAYALPTAAPIVNGQTIWVVNNSGGAVSVNNTTVGVFAIANGQAQQFLFVSAVSGVNWVPVQ